MQNDCMDAGRAVRILNTGVAKLRGKPEYASIFDTASDVATKAMVLRAA